MRVGCIYRQKNMNRCDICYKETDELYECGGYYLCEDCLLTEAASIIVNDDIPPDLDDF